MYLTDIEAFDPDPRVSGAYTKFMCNQPACEGKPDDSIHKSLSVNMETGVWHCFRCSAHGVLEDDVFDEVPQNQWSKPDNAHARMKSRFIVDGPE
jgi:hypothetical protein